MEKYKKKDIIRMIATFMKANATAIKAAVSDPSGLTEVLTQCQESAILVGTYLETLADGYPKLVNLLENYCEDLYQMSINLTNEGICRKLSKKIQKELAALQNGIRSDLPDDRKEVVFLPYKASMWDSLESVWKAVDADSNSDAYVIPIPYFDRNPDGSFREEHYEGNLYPKYVPITHYGEYDFESRRPDTIFIHNAYDDANYVTSVHPFFYSDNLKKFTDKLVYIPYFILRDIRPDEKAAIEGMKHFCLLPGIFHADKVIVQSENMRQIYIDVLTEEMAGKENAARKKQVRAYWEQKIDGSGSPKIDKVLNTKKEDIEVPKEWLKIIEKPDGTWKKVIFYNTGVSSLLHDEEKLFTKIQDVFRIFKEKRDEVALLWRPHPLIEATIKSMRPKLQLEYENIVEEYRAEGWGIYDDTANMDRAVALADAYYGDGSSVACLFQKAGKPVMYQNIDVREANQENISVYPSDYCIEDNKVWFIHGRLSILCCYDMVLRELSVVKYIPVENPFQETSFCGICKKGNKIILIPAWARGIYIYYLKEDKLKKIELKDVEKKKEKILFANVIYERNILYCIPYAYDYIVKIDAITDEYWYLKRPNDGMESIISKAVWMGESKIIGVWSQTNRVFIYDLSKEKIIRNFTADIEKKFCDIVSDGKQVYIIDNSNYSLLGLNLDNGIFEEIYKYKNQTLSLDIIYNQCLLLDDIYGAKVTVINFEGKKIFSYRKRVSDNDNSLRCSFMHGLYREFKDSYYFDRTSSILYQKLNDGRIRYHIFSFCQKQIDALSTIFEKNNQGVWDEKEIFTLKKWIKCLVSVNPE